MKTITYIGVLIAAIYIGSTAVIRVHQYKEALEEQKEAYQRLKRDFLWYEHAYLKCIHEIPEDDIDLRLPPEYESDY